MKTLSTLGLGWRGGGGGGGGEGRSLGIPLPGGSTSQAPAVGGRGPPSDWILYLRRRSLDLVTTRTVFRRKTLSLEAMLPPDYQRIFLSPHLRIKGLKGAVLALHVEAGSYTPPQHIQA